MNNRLIRILILTTTAFFLLTILFLPSSICVAADDFTTDYHITYTIDQAGAAAINQDITLINNTSNRYVSDYTLTVPLSKITDISAVNSQGQLKTLVEQQENSQTIKVILGSSTTGLGTKTNWTLTYHCPNFAEKRGRLWHVVIPKIQHSTSINSFQLEINASDKLGEPQFIIPLPSETNHLDNINQYKFLNAQGEKVKNSGLVADFGDYQLFSFYLTYHLSNPLDTAAVTEIALIPNFPPYQKVFIKSLSPLPKKIEKDLDGNYLATYQLKAHENAAITFQGQVAVDLSPNRAYPKTSANYYALQARYTQPAKYWETTDPAIQKIVQENVNQQMSTQQKARTLYAYVLKTLTYNSLNFEGDKSTAGQKLKRLGALGALNEPDNCVCMEFTDLLITLLRSAGIPARELDGYAYSPDISNHPKGDVLHSWVQFYDREMQKWISVDPTWESTSGRDYFTAMDTDRIIFVIKGIDSEKPYPAGSYKSEDNKETQDVKISFAQQREKGTIPFSLWKQNWENENQKVELLDKIFRWIVKTWEKIKRG
ncbi:hypothetical protein B5M47_01230 [candidate division CPR3 bacterium 4484_211]|uniref:Transglutaminase-like domain-containing protein n=1 Tax=candidate division CPR3 bacterium 4484_211 TaxID=1968527 RepID=A0A1W9NYU1_UNCC3|nr:MAG: hypothetical protein B5M47_01230 [candidate division CPR3 bacterium 4484_211]RLD03200.1 MAG: hypothetical protein DRI56_12890 [Chloroflexota bacterium]